VSRLAEALAALLDQDDRPPCCWPDVGGWWLSESADARARAAEHCHGCGILTDCREAAEDNREVFGVDRTPATTRKARR
jgi:hypothetical protein